jgi:hypothetical protein
MTVTLRERALAAWDVQRREIEKINAEATATHRATIKREARQVLGVELNDDLTTDGLCFTLNDRQLALTDTCPVCGGPRVSYVVTSLERLGELITEPRYWYHDCVPAQTAPEPFTCTAAERHVLEALREYIREAVSND